MAKYIKNKKVNMNKSNKINDLQGISKATWKFIYNAGWNSLVTDIHNNIFRQKISLHCTPKTNLVKNGNIKVYSSFLFYFHSPFNLCFIFLFLELRDRVRVTVTSHDMVGVMIGSHMTHKKT